MNPLEPLAYIAESQIGTQEDPAHTNSGPAILKYQQATDLRGQGWPWCAAFVDWCVQEMCRQYPTITRFSPHTASAFGLVDWGKANGALILNSNPQRGDIVVFPFSHCGIVTRKLYSEDGFHTVEGNTNPVGGRDGYVVAAKYRALDPDDLFVRLPVMAKEVA